MPSCQAGEGEAEKNAIEFIELNNIDWQISNYEHQNWTYYWQEEILKILVKRIASMQ